jgi:hypothetical protein
MYLGITRATIIVVLGYFLYGGIGGGLENLGLCDMPLRKARLPHLFNFHDGKV